MVAAAVGSAWANQGLTLETPETASPPANLAVGERTLERVQQQTLVWATESYTLPLPSPEQAGNGMVATQPAAHVVEKLSPLSRVLDYRALRLPGMETDEIYLMAPTRIVQPFAVVARQNLATNALEDTTRMGVGTGARLRIGRQADFGAELLVFPRDRMTDIDRGGPVNALGDVQVLTRLQIKF